MRFGCTFLLSCVVYTVGVAAEPLPTIEEVRKAHATARGVVQTAYIECTVELGFPGLAREAEPDLVRQFRDHPRELTENRRAIQINETGRVNKVQAYFSASSNEWKIDSRDIRDLDALLSNGEGSSSADRAMVDTSSVILRDNGIEARWQIGPEWLFIQEADPRDFAASLLLAGPVTFGVIADHIFQRYPQALISADNLAGRPVVSVKFTSDNKGTYLLKVDPAIGYRSREIRILSTEGRLLVECTEDDYRKVNGVFLPFHTVERHYRPDGSVKQYKEITVNAARFNQPLKPDTFVLNVPAEVMIIPLAEHHMPLTLREPRTLTTADLKTLYKQTETP